MSKSNRGISSLSNYLSRNLARDVRPKAYERVLQTENSATLKKCHQNRRSSAVVSCLSTDATINCTGDVGDHLEITNFGIHRKRELWL